MPDLPREPKLIDFTKVAMEAGYSMGLDFYKAWLDLGKLKRRKKPYTREEEALLIERRRVYGSNW
jgi:hypothetical protein